MPILGRILRDRGVVTERQLQEAIQHQVLYGGRLGTSLHELGFITEERLQDALSKAHGVPAMPVDLREVEPETVALVPRAMAAQHKVFPYRLRGKTLFLLMVDPSDHGAVARVGFTLGYIVRPVVVPEFREAPDDQRGRVPGPGEGTGREPRLRRQWDHGQREAEPGGAAGAAAAGAAGLPADHPQARGRGPQGRRRCRRGGGGEGERMIERMKELRRRRKRKEKRRKARLKETRAAAAKKPAAKR